jgi:hypothetical protein
MYGSSRDLIEPRDDAAGDGISMASFPACECPMRMSAPTLPAARARRMSETAVVAAVQMLDVNSPVGHRSWLGHRSITGTAVYTVLTPNRFNDFWR